MNARSRLLVLPAILAMTVGSMFADTKPAMVVQVVSTDDQDGYVAMITKINAVAKAKTGLEKIRHVWVGDFAGENAHGIFVVSTFASVAAEAEFTAKLKDDADMAALLAQLKSMRKLGPAWLYKAVRSDGIYEGGSVYNTSIVCTDEDGYLKNLESLKAIFDANGFKDSKVNLYRVVAGRKESTHLVVLSFPSEARVAELLDAISDKGIMKDWYVAAAKNRTVVNNGTYHEITK